MIADDFSVASNGDIRWVGGAATYTVLEFHRYLQNLADDVSAAGDDLIDITSLTPSDRSTDNIITLLGAYNIDDTATQHLYDGSISQSSGAVIYAGLIVVGSVASPTTQLQIVQNNALLSNYWSTGINADPANNILLRLIVKVRTAGADIDGRRLRVQAREMGDTFAEFTVTMGLGNNVAAIATQSDLNNQTAPATIAIWTDILNTEGYQQIDINNNGLRPYYSQWDLGTRSINALYERTKWIQRRGSTTTIHGINGELFRGISHSFAYSSESGGPFLEDEVITWGSGASAGSGLILALKDDGTTGAIYLQLLTGIAPTDSTALTGVTSAATALVNGAVTPRTVSPTFIGSSTGSAIIVAYGVGIQASDLTASDLLTDLLGVAQTPPNNVVFSVSGLGVGTDYVLVGPESSGSLHFAQLAAVGSSAGAGTLAVTTPIPSDTPASGTIRAFNGANFDRIPYSSYSGSTFTLTGTLPNAIAPGANIFISYLDKLSASSSESFTSIYASDRPLFVRVRSASNLNPIKTFESPATLGSAGGSVAAIRTPDS